MESLTADPASTLSIVIPVWNEEEAIQSVLDEAVEARQHIPRDEPRVRRVEVLIVDDGSTDRTREIALRCGEVRVISIPHAGYGAALKAGFSAAEGDLLAFMDGDGTCNPRLFGRLSVKILDGEADVVNGNRLHRDSRMPFVRSFGNRVIGKTMSVLSGTYVQDACTGMRVFHRSLLPRMESFPEDLSYSPALTALVLFAPDLRIAEVPIDYRERLGKSKLSLVRDTGRFFREAFKARGRERRAARQRNGGGLPGRDRERDAQSFSGEAS